MRNLDFSSSQAVFSTVLGLGLITLIGVGIRLAISADEDSDLHR
jgi:hypothetical protein